MKTLTTIATAAFALAAVIGGIAISQPAYSQPAGALYYDQTPWPLPDDNSVSAFKLNGMTSAHAVWMAFTNYAGEKPALDSPVMTLLAGSTVRWSAPQGGCTYELELVNANPPVINMKKPYSICSLKPGAQVLFRIYAAP